MCNHVELKEGAPRYGDLLTLLAKDKWKSALFEDLTSFTQSTTPSDKAYIATAATFYGQGKPLSDEKDFRNISLAFKGKMFT